MFHFVDFLDVDFHNYAVPQPTFIRKAYYTVEREQGVERRSGLEKTLTTMDIHHLLCQSTFCLF